MKLTQQQIANHLDLAQKNVSVFLSKLEFDWRSATLDDIRIAYIRKLRAQAESYRTKDADLVTERILTERIDRELKEFALAEKKAQLINVAQLEVALVEMVGSLRDGVRLFDTMLKSKIDAQYGIDLDIAILEASADDALSHLGRYLPRAPDDVGVLTETA